MTYKEKDIESLEEGPIYHRIIRKRVRELQDRGWRRWYSWTKVRYKLNKVSKDSLLGRSIHQISEKYLHLLPGDERDVHRLMDYLDINTLGKGDLFHNRYGSDIWRHSFPIYYLCPKNNTIKMYLSKHAKIRWSKRKLSHVGTTKEERLKRFYKDRSARRKRVRERKKERELEATISLQWMRDRRSQEKHDKYIELMIARAKFLAEILEGIRPPLG